MPVTPGQKAPDFKTTALIGRAFQEISLHDYAGSWVVLFFYPMNFTSLCPTEIIDFNEMFKNFDASDTVLIGGSTDTEFSHVAWVQSHPDLGALHFPLFSDRNRRIAMDYGVLVPEEGYALRGTFIIDPRGIVRWMSIHDLYVGRNVSEILRVLNALQTNAFCPSNWHPGDETLCSAVDAALLNSRQS